MRHGGLRAALAGAQLVHHQRFAGFVAQRGSLQESFGVGHAFEQAGNRLAARVGGEIGDLVGHVDVARVAAGEHVAERKAVLQRLRQRGADGARLAHQADRAGTRGALERRAAEGADQAQPIVHESDAVRPQHAHARGARDVQQPLLGSHPLGHAGLGIAGGEQHHPAHAARRALLDDRFHGVAWHGDEHAVGRFRQRGDRGIARLLADALVLGIDHVHRAGKAAGTGDIGVGDRAERVRIGRDADHGDGAGREHARQLVGPVQRAGVGHGRTVSCGYIDLARPS